MVKNKMIIAVILQETVSSGTINLGATAATITATVKENIIMDKHGLVRTSQDFASSYVV